MVKRRGCTAGRRHSLVAKEPSGQEKRMHSLLAKRRGSTASWSREEEAQPCGQKKREHSLWTREEDAQPGGGTA